MLFYSLKNICVKSCFACLVAFFVETINATETIEPIITDSIVHIRSHFTQGLFFDNGDLIESTGQYGESGLYRLNANGFILDSIRIPERYFGEGSVAVGEDLFYLTWKSHKAFVYSKKPFALKNEFRIPTEGWGLTYYKNALLMSNGSSTLLQIGLGGFNVIGSINVTDNGNPVTRLNELEVVGDTLYANIWQTDSIAVIYLGKYATVVRYLDLHKKANDIRRMYKDSDVLNGIAYDGKNLWITGKNWPYIYKIAK